MAVSEADSFSLSSAAVTVRWSPCRSPVYAAACYRLQLLLSTAGLAAWLPGCLAACPSSAARRPPPAAAVLEFLMKLGVRARARLVGRGPRCRSRSIHAP